jgi:hypothetical protein
LSEAIEPFGVLVEHRVHEVDERLVAAEQTVAAREEVALEPPLAGVLGQQLHDPTAAGEVLVDVQDLPGEHLVGDAVDGVEPIGRRLVRPEDPERLRIASHNVDEPPAELARGLVDRTTRLVDGHGRRPE